MHSRNRLKIIVLDMDSSVSPTHGEQEGTAYNGHFGCTCYHPLFVFNQFGDLERCALRPGNVHSAHEWRDVLEPVVARYRDRLLRRYFRGDAAFALPGIYEFLEAEGFRYAIRLPANRVLQDSIGHLLKRPVGRPPKDVRRYYASFSYRAATWTKPRRVVAKVEWHPGELYPRVGFIVTNLSRRAERVVAFYNQRGTAEQHIKEGKNAIKWTRLSCRRFDHNAVRLQLHALAYNLGNFMRTLALPDAVEQWSLTSLREKLIKIGAKIVRHGRYVTFQMAEVAIPRDLFADILRRNYGEISNEFLRNMGNTYDESQDVEDRNECLERLKAYARTDFLGDDGRAGYQALPGSSPWKERLADIFSGIADATRIASPIIQLVNRDLVHYWEPDAAFGTDVRWTLTVPLRDALLTGDEILLVAHSLGTMISYDVLWKLSHYGEYSDLRNRLSNFGEKRPVTFVTLGSPLGNETIKRHLKGSNATGFRRYPSLIRTWHNFAAEDDYVSHDETLADDYRKLVRDGFIESIADHRIYNLALRHGTSNPHHGAGYLIPCLSGCHPYPLHLGCSQSPE